jgi:hypothetical protein
LSRLSDALTAAAARSFPRERGADARVVRDCAREAIDAAGLRALPRESLSLAAAGFRARAGLVASDLRHAPWRAALSALTLPLAAAILLVWTFGFVPRYDHWPLGEGWALLLGGSLTAVIGAAARSRWLTAAGALATFVAAAAPHFEMGTEMALAHTPSFFDGGMVDFAAASLLPTLLMLAGALCLPRKAPRSILATVGRSARALLPAAVAGVALLPASEPRPTYGFEYLGPDVAPRLTVGPPYPMPWIPPADTLLTLLAVALALAVVIAWERAETNPTVALASGLVLVSVAYPAVWVSIRYLPVPYWFYDARFVGLLAILPLLLALILMRRGARAERAPIAAR